VYIKSFFIIILFYVPVIIYGWGVVYKIVIGELVVREDGKFLQYKHIKPTYERRWYR
jgi:hypothetical protein